MTSGTHYDLTTTSLNVRGRASFIVSRARSNQRQSESQSGATRGGGGAGESYVRQVRQAEDVELWYGTCSPSYGARNAPLRSMTADDGTTLNRNDENKSSQNVIQKLRSPGTPGNPRLPEDTGRVYQQLRRRRSHFSMHAVASPSRQNVSTNARSLLVDRWRRCSGGGVVCSRRCCLAGRPSGSQASVNIDLEPGKSQTNPCPPGRDPTGPAARPVSAVCAWWIQLIAGMYTDDDDDDVVVARRNIINQCTSAHAREREPVDILLPVYSLAGPTVSSVLEAATSR